MLKVEGSKYGISIHIYIEKIFSSAEALSSRTNHLNFWCKRSAVRNQVPGLEDFFPSLNVSVYTPVLLTWVKEESVFCRGTQSATNLECDVMDLDKKKKKKTCRYLGLVKEIYFKKLS